MAVMKKVLLKVDKNGEQTWVHFCYIPADVSDRFFKVTGIERQSLSSYIEHWIRDDYDVKVKVETYEDIEKARSTITSRFKRDYAELYIMGDNGGNPSVYGIVRMWLVQHMRIEIAKYELNGEA